MHLFVVEGTANVDRSQLDLVPAAGAVVAAQMPSCSPLPPLQMRCPRRMISRLLDAYAERDAQWTRCERRYAGELRARYDRYTP
jgi:hypothetical protein